MRSLQRSWKRAISPASVIAFCGACWVSVSAGGPRGDPMAPSRPRCRFAGTGHGEIRAMKRLLVVFVAVLTAASAITALAVAGSGPGTGSRYPTASGLRESPRARAEASTWGQFPPGGCLRSTRRPEPRRRPSPPARDTRRSASSASGAREPAVRERRPHWQGIRLRRERRCRACGVPADRAGTGHVHQRRRPHARSRVLHGLPAAGDLRGRQDLSGVRPIALTNFPMTAGQNNLNGIEAARNGRVLLAVRAPRACCGGSTRRPGRTRRWTSTGPSSPTATGCSSPASARCWWCRTARTR